jgi:hypothetical protein
MMVYEPKFIQIAACQSPNGGSRLFALDEDGNVWELTTEETWRFIGSPAGIDKQ